MGYKSDIEIAQETEMLPVDEIAKTAASMRSIWSITESIRLRSITIC